MRIESDIQDIYGEIDVDVYLRIFSSCGIRNLAKNCLFGKLPRYLINIFVNIFG